MDVMENLEILWELNTPQDSRLQKCRSGLVPILKLQILLRRSQLHYLKKKNGWTFADRGAAELDAASQPDCCFQ